MTEQNHAYEQAGSQLESIVEMVAALNVDYARLRNARKRDADWNEDSTVSMEPCEPDDAAELAELRAAAGDCENEEQAREAIQNDRYRLQVRAGWHDPGTVDMTPEEFEILLCTGGPAVASWANSTIISKPRAHGSSIRIGARLGPNTTARTTPLHCSLYCKLLLLRSVKP